MKSIKSKQSSWAFEFEVERRFETEREAERWTEEREMVGWSHIHRNNIENVDQQENEAKHKEQIKSSRQQSKADVESKHAYELHVSNWTYNDTNMNANTGSRRKTKQKEKNE